MLADLLFGRYVVEVRFGWETNFEALPGRHLTWAGAQRRAADLARQGKFRHALVRPALRRQRCTSGPLLTVDLRAPGRSV